jgi:cytoskeletal protein RodZ
VTRKAERLRRLGGEESRAPFGRLLVAAAIAALGLGGGPAAAQGSGPERPPVKAPVKLGPEPAPGAQTATPSTSTSTTTSSSASTSTSSSSQVAPTTSSQQVGVVTSTRSAPPQQRPATIARPKPQTRPPAKPKATHAVKTAVTSLAHTIQRPATRIALSAAPAGSSDSNRLLFLGGLALLVLVLGDAAFLAFSARVLRER